MMAAPGTVTNRIVFISPSRDYVELIRDTYDEHSREYAKTSEDNHTYSFSVMVATFLEDLSGKCIDADTIIARGVLSSQLKQSNREAAIIDVPIGSEVATAAWRAFERYGRLPMAIIGSFNIVHAAHGLEDVLKADIKYYLQRSNAGEDIERILDKVAADGRRIVLCGVNTNRYARKRDCLPVVIGMGKESIWQAISEAKRGALIRRKEREKAEQFRTVLNHAYEGVIATDVDGRVTVFNAAAADILQTPAATGKPLEEVVPGGRLNAALRGHGDFKDRLVQYNSELLSVSKASVMLGGDFSGHIITLQRSSAIQRAESLIRKKLYAKGHVAKYALADVIGDSPAIRATLVEAERFAKVSSNILIVGETGTGKELFAQGIHNASPRKDAPFVAVNCAALAKNLLESELFGYAEGAFTGALKGGKPGMFEIAHTGTIFLDEISEIPLDLQGRLLRVIQERQIMRVGGDSVAPVDVRIVCATNKPLSAEVRRNRFRRDLYYRLNVLTLAIPNLNRRGADVLRLAEFFLEENGRRFFHPPPSLADEARDLLLRHRWEGNIRELRNVCECLAVLDDDGVIGADDAERALSRDLSADGGDGGSEDERGAGNAEDGRDLERERLARALRASQGNRKRAAASLGISTTTLWRRRKNLGIDE
ncbi:MAG: sigma 54-interacting transcriptional regulator [Planctomycetota bacterium]|jgi:transcriptional regulator with PAS, ATPase and Fis domain|nr:sigma 54-interacting transcriptional regulator [Planctomycetota bacterium]